MHSQDKIKTQKSTRMSMSKHSTAKPSRAPTIKHLTWGKNTIKTSNRLYLTLILIHKDICLSSNSKLKCRALPVTLWSKLQWNQQLPASFRKIKSKITSVPHPSPTRKLENHQRKQRSDIMIMKKSNKVKERDLITSQVTNIVYNTSNTTQCRSWSPMLYSHRNLSKEN